MKTKGSILIQRDANKWPGILESSPKTLEVYLRKQTELLEKKTHKNVVICCCKKNVFGRQQP